ncbi:DUF484 family protein [Gayadomonas joobiniege]|uniref:DUF484 family protein n=1 Tax=Gayadomonas joobiniege TaxID=1234606 RepID=UPI000366E1F5|nr:DUF484 family protein [Gayadomonas joobiniege]
MSQNTDKHKLTEQAIADYLLANPDFLLQRQDVLEQLKLVPPIAGTVSLLDRQQALLRKKNQKLESEMAELISTAKRNENIYKIFIKLYMQLLECPDSDNLLYLLNQVLLDQIELDGLKLILFIAGGDEKTAALVVPRQNYQKILHDRLKQTDFYFGRLNRQEMAMFFDPETDIRSVALIRLGGNKEMGILAFGSQDELHFQGDMDTLFLTPMVTLINRLLLDFSKENRELG